MTMKHMSKFGLKYGRSKAKGVYCSQSRLSFIFTIYEAFKSKKKNCKSKFVAVKLD